jgi:4-carboxymuconolactone decarboxylase
MMRALDDETRELVRLAIVIAARGESEIREAMAHAARGAVPAEWVEELVLQTYLFAGFPRTLNAAREWRKASGHAAPESDAGASYANVARWHAEGERTCAIVYGDMYERLRRNIEALHPALDAWMVVEGYGKILSRPALDLKRRELCIVAVCAALEQERQLHSHLHGALHSGASNAEVEQALRLALERVSREVAERYLHLWSRVKRES